MSNNPQASQILKHVCSVHHLCSSLTGTQRVNFTQLQRTSGPLGPRGPWSPASPGSPWGPANPTGPAGPSGP